MTRDPAHLMIPSLLPSPSLDDVRRVLVIQPHYDDADIAAGGTLASLADAGAAIRYCTVLDDLVGVIDETLSDEAAAASLLRDQRAAAAIIGVNELTHLGFPDAGNWSRFDVRPHLFREIREFRPDVIFTADPWLSVEAHRDHWEVGSVAAEAAILFGIPKLPSSNVSVDAAWRAAPPFDLRAVVFFYTDEPNTFVSIDGTWVRKSAAVSEYRAQFSVEELPQLVTTLDEKAAQVARVGVEAGRLPTGTTRAEALKVIDPRALHGAR
jgi:LmbE family N-acetylglucosaminyl deacetylase